MENRVKYYPCSDYLYAHNLTKIEVIIVPNYESIDINDAIEFFEIKRYFDENTRCLTWTNEQYAEYTEKAKKLNSLTMRFFNQITNDNIVSLYESIEFGYHSDFWRLFDLCKLYNNISDTTFAELIECERISPFDLFLHKTIVNHYGEVLKNYILSHEFCIKIILHFYQQDYTEGDKLYLPSELNANDVDTYLKDYIDSEKPNMNHLKEIIDMPPNKRFPITDENRLKAKRKYDDEVKSIFESGKGAHFGYGCQLTFDPEQESIVSSSQSGDTFSLSYSTKHLLDTLDYPSLLNNFIYVFEFVDCKQMRSLHVLRKSQSGVFERAFASKSTKIYAINHAFEFSQGIANMQMESYYAFLEYNKVHIEDAILWMFTQYLQEEFGCPEIRVSMPSVNTTFAEKCTSIISAFESVLKQYSLYVKNGEIDFDLVAMSTTPVKFENVNSLVSNKYVYGAGNDYNMLTFWLFSDQCTFSFIERLYDEGHSYDRFIDLLVKEIIYISDYRDHEKGAFETMEKYDLVQICDDGQIKPKNMIKLLLLKDLYNNDVVSRYSCSRKVQKAIDEFIQQGLLEEGSTLFSKPEINYLNYMLNRAEYSNGLEIRNKYVHGNQQVNIDENEHRKNYLKLLRLFVLFAIKVNDDFCLREALNNREEEDK